MIIADEAGVLIIWHCHLARPGYTDSSYARQTAPTIITKATMKVRCVHGIPLLQASAPGSLGEICASGHTLDPSVQAEHRDR